MRNKGQAAIEFLTTYGWAMLVVLVMIGALAYFGVIDPSGMLPEKCVFSVGVGCRDFAGIASKDTISALLINSFGYTVVVSSVQVDVSGTRGSFTQCAAANEWCNVTDGGAEWRSGSEKSLDIAFPAAGGGLNEGDKPKVYVEMNYTKAGSVYSKRLTGTIQVRPTG